MTLRQEIGIICGATGVLINAVHLVLFFFSNKSEKYHDDLWIVGLGVVLAFGGVLLLSDPARKR